MSLSILVIITTLKLICPLICIVIDDATPLTMQIAIELQQAGDNVIYNAITKTFRNRVSPAATWAREDERNNKSPHNLISK